MEQNHLKRFCRFTDSIPPDLHLELLGKGERWEFEFPFRRDKVKDWQGIPSPYRKVSHLC